MKKMNRKMLTALAVPALMLMGATPAQADHGHNCVWSGGAWVGQGLCPGMPGFVPHTAAPTEEPTTAPVEPAPVTSPAPVVTEAPTVPRATTAPNPPKVKIPPRPVAVPSTTVPRAWQTQAPKPPGVTRSYGQNFVVLPASVESPVSVPVTDWSDICHTVCVA